MKRRPSNLRHTPEYLRKLWLEKKGAAAVGLVLAQTILVENDNGRVRRPRGKR